MMEYKLDSVYNKSSPYIDHSESLFVVRAKTGVSAASVFFLLLFLPR